MSEWGFPLAAGLLLGVFFFGGLWWTVRRALSPAQPALWFLLSLLLRTVLTLTGFYLVAAGDGQRLLTCLFGFTVVRVLAAYLPSPPGPQTTSGKRKIAHAP
jgi:F1F0 ATPase subunit 2